MGKCFCLPIYSLKEKMKNAVCFIHTSDPLLVALSLPVNVCKSTVLLKYKKGMSLQMCPGDYENFKFP